jgi:hypothetical protein
MERTRLIALLILLNLAATGAIILFISNSSTTANIRGSLLASVSPGTDG